MTKSDAQPHTDQTDLGASDSVRVLGLEDSDVSRPDRSLLHRAEDLRYGRTDIPVDVLRQRVTDFLHNLRDVLGQAPATVGDFDLDQIQVSAEVSAKGHISLLGAGGELAGKGGLTFTFKRNNSSQLGNSEQHDQTARHQQM